MGHRLLFVAAIVLGLAPVSASAEGILHRASCSVVRYYVAKYSASMAEAMAGQPSGSPPSSDPHHGWSLSMAV